ncbi:MAG: anti-sigma factor [Solirubrobacterales bacterium]|nr:anti-sigma factor [Solirubrobacterales bacterium]
MTDGHELSDYLLGELDDDARARVEQRIAQDPSFGDQIKSLRPIVERLQDIPAGAWQSLGSAPVRTEPERRRFPRRRGLMPKLAMGLAALVLFAVGLGAGILLEKPSGAGSQGLALNRLADAPPGAAGTAQLVGSDRLRLVVKNLSPTRTGVYYEAWLMSSARVLVPLASFSVDQHGHAQVELQLPASPTRYRFIDVSLQRTGSVEHSGISVLRGATSPT